MVAGDWDANQRWAARVINHAADHGAGFVVQCGDFGYHENRGWTDVYLSHLDSVLARRGIELYWVDGNHENHPLLVQIPIDPETGRRPITDYISHLPRGYRWCWHGQTWLALGGAHSVDRRWGRQGRDWWPEEELSTEDTARAIQGGPADVIVAHDCPAGVATSASGWKRSRYGPLHWIPAARSRATNESCWKTPLDLNRRELVRAVEHLSDTQARAKLVPP